MASLQHPARRRWSMWSALIIGWAALGTLMMSSPAGASTTPASPEGRAVAPGVPTAVAARSTRSPHRNSVGLSDGVIVTVRNATDLASGRLAATRSTVLLHIDGLPLTGVAPTRNSVDADGNGDIEFFIPHTAPAIKLWSTLIQLHRGFSARLPVSVGIEGQPPIATQVDGTGSFEIVLARQWWFAGIVALVGALVVLSVFLAARTDLLRDSGPVTWTSGARRSFSLARVSGAVWTVSIIAAWLILYVFKHSMNTVTDSMVQLMGISAGTTLSAGTLDGGRSAPIASASRGFLADILSDHGAVDFHRFQLVAWTVVTNVVFWRQILLYFEMPKFPSEILLLMGISSATYLGSKLPGVRKGEPVEVAPAAAPAVAVGGSS